MSIVFVENQLVNCWIGYIHTMSFNMKTDINSCFNSQFWSGIQFNSLFCNVFRNILQFLPLAFI